jgi:hypothetical protein
VGPAVRTLQQRLSFNDCFLAGHESCAIGVARHLYPRLNPVQQRPQHRRQDPREVQAREGRSPRTASAPRWSRWTPGARSGRRRGPRTGCRRRRRRRCAARAPCGRRRSCPRWRFRGGARSSAWGAPGAARRGRPRAPPQGHGGGNDHALGDGFPAGREASKMVRTSHTSSEYIDLWSRLAVAAATHL